MIHPQQKTLLQVDVKELKGKPGVQETLSSTVPAPAGFATVLVGIPEASDLNVDLRLESVHEGVLVSGSASAEVAGECGRCLDPLSYPLSVDVMQLFIWDGDIDDDDEDTRAVAEDLTVDVELMLRDLMVSDLPFQPVCREDCPGLCSQCGFRMEDDPEHAHEQLDPRWAALSNLAAELNNDDEDESPSTKG